MHGGTAASWPVHFNMTRTTCFFVQSDLHGYLPVAGLANLTWLAQLQIVF